MNYLKIIVLLQSENSQKEEYAQMKAELAVSKEQLRNYELMEKEIDDAVMGLGKIGVIFVFFA